MLFVCFRATIFSNPLEVVKTRLQLQGEMQELLKIKNKKTLKFVDTFTTILKDEGLRGIQRGLLPAMGYNFCMNGVRFSLYGPIKEILSSSTQQQNQQSSQVEPVFLINVMSGFLSGSLGAFFGSPFYMMKVRIQSYSPMLNTSELVVGGGHQHGYASLRDAVSSIVSGEGWTGLWRGATSGMLRTGVGSATQLATYDQVKFGLMVNLLNLSPDSMLTHFLASFVSGFAVVTIFNPFDVINTRLYNQKLDPISGKPALYSGIWDCFVKTCRVEGVSSLYKGYWPHAIRVGPHTILTFVFLEQIKSIISSYQQQ